jgi:hypothetical protein
VLGCIRDGAPIAHDRDTDFGFMEEDLPKFEASLGRLRWYYHRRQPSIETVNEVPAPAGLTGRSA